MTHATGYYSLIQYCPDPSRLEAANIGVLLFSPKHCFLKARTLRDNRRIIQFFGREGHDWVRINSYKKAIEERLQVENGTIRSLDDLERFIAKRANRIQITPPRPMRVQEPEKDLDELFKELLATEGQRPERTNLRKYLRQQFARAGVQKKIRTDITVVVPSFNNKTVEIPYGYQNGRFNLIQPARFQSTDTDNAIATACKYAVEGRSLFDNRDPELGDLQLVVVGEFPPTKVESRKVVGTILQEHQVKFFTLAEVDRLIADIRENGKELPEESNQPA
jgi:hypothetical protein